MTKDIDKKINTMNILNIAYDSASISDNNVPEIYREKFIAKLIYEKGYFIYKVGISEDNINIRSSQCLLQYTNKKIKNFYLESRGYNLPTEHDKFKTKIKFKNKEINYESTPRNTLEFRQFLGDYANELDNIPKIITFSVEIHRITNEIYRQNWFEKDRGGSINTIMNNIFCPKVNDDRIRNAERKSRYKNPFSYPSLKHRLYIVNKEIMIFTIEYLYGKKINKNLITKDICKILRGLPNTRFGINDVQVAKKLTSKISYCSIESTFKGLMSLGIKPATDLKRWNKKYNLTDTKEI